ARRRLARPAEARYAPGEVREEAGPRHLPVVAHADARGELTRAHVTHGRFRLARQRRLIDRLSPILPDKEIAQRRRPRQAAHVSDEDPALAPDHGPGSYYTRSSIPSR